MPVESFNTGSLSTLEMAISLLTPQSIRKIYLQSYTSLPNAKLHYQDTPPLKTNIYFFLKGKCLKKVK